jgi:hypothetical protein
MLLSFVDGKKTDFSFMRRADASCEDFIIWRGTEAG